MLGIKSVAILLLQYTKSDNHGMIFRMYFIYNGIYILHERGMRTCLRAQASELIQSELLHVVVRGFETKTARSPMDAPSPSTAVAIALTIRPWPIVKNGLAPAEQSNTQPMITSQLERNFRHWAYHDIETLCVLCLCGGIYHRHCDCLLNGLFRLKVKKCQSSALPSLVSGA